MIFTTNCVKDFNDAIQSRISLGLHYGPLGVQYEKDNMGKLPKEGSDS